MAENFYSKAVQRPVVNGEPCYEGHGHWGANGRFSRFDVRKAAWQSVLSGAKAGVTYGAHGIWSWHVNGKSFPSEGYSKIPYDRKTALQFEGAWDYSLLKWIFEAYELFDLLPMDILCGQPEDIRASISANSNKIVVYIPFAIDVKLNIDTAGFEWTLINLSKKLFAKPEVISADGTTTIKMHRFNSDVVVIGIKRED